jgi:hypothetical protein
MNSEKSLKKRIDLEMIEKTKKYEIVHLKSLQEKRFLRLGLLMKQNIY